MKIELIKPGEEFSVSAICSRCIKDINSNDLDQSSINLLLEEFSPSGILSFSEKYYVFVAKKDDGEILGTGTLANNQIKGVFVTVDSFGMGIGKSIMNHLELYAEKLGHNNIYLTSSMYAVKFYLKLGYKIVNMIETEVGKMARMEKAI